MRITRKRLAEMIEESIHRHIIRLYEKESAQGEEDEDPNGDGRKRSMDRNPNPGPPELGTNDEPDDEGPGKGPVDPALDPDGETPDDDMGPADGSAERDAQDERDGLDVRGDATKEATGKVNDWASGKTIQSVTVTESDEYPGAKEVVITTNETTDPLRILVTQQGTVKFILTQGGTPTMHDTP